MSKKGSYILVNHDIKADRVRVISADGKVLGVFELKAAIDLAADKGLDLVAVAPGSSPPVCKLLDSAKYRYDLVKKANDLKKRQKSLDMKEIRLRPNIAAGDFNVKVNKAKDFLSNYNKVKISLFFKGREVVHEDVGFDVMNRFKAELVGCSKIEVDVKKEDKNIFMIVSPSN